MDGTTTVEVEPSGIPDDDGGIPQGNKNSTKSDGGKKSPNNTVVEDDGENNDENTDDKDETYFLKLGVLVSMVVACFKTSLSMHDAFQDEKKHSMAIMNAVSLGGFQLPVLLILMYVFLKKWIKAKIKACLSARGCCDICAKRKEGDLHIEGTDEDPELGNDDLDPEFRDGIDPEFRDGIDPEFRDGIDPEFRDGIDPEFRDGIDPEFRDDIDPEFRDDIDPEFPDDAINPDFQGDVIDREIRADIIDPEIQDDIIIPEIRSYNFQAVSKSHPMEENNEAGKESIEHPPTWQPSDVITPTHVATVHAQHQSGRPHAPNTYTNRGSTGDYLPPPPKYNKRRNQQTNPGKKTQKLPPKHTQQMQHPSHVPSSGDWNAYGDGRRSRGKQKQQQSRRRERWPDDDLPRHNPRAGQMDAPPPRESRGIRKGQRGKGLQLPWKSNKQRRDVESKPLTDSGYLEPSRGGRDGHIRQQYGSPRRRESPYRSPRNQNRQPASFQEGYDVIDESPMSERLPRRRPQNQRNSRRYQQGGDEATPLYRGHEATPLHPGHEATPLHPGHEATPLHPGHEATPLHPGHEATPLHPGHEATLLQPGHPRPRESYQSTNARSAGREDAFSESNPRHKSSNFNKDN